MSGGYKAGNLGFRWVSCRFGDNTPVAGPVAVLGCIWDDRGGVAPGIGYKSTLGVWGVFPLSFDASGDYKVSQAPFWMTDMIDGFQRQDILKTALALGANTYELLKGGYDCEPYWLPSDWVFNKSGGAGGLNDTWWFLIAYPKNGRLH